MTTIVAKVIFAFPNSGWALVAFLATGTVGVLFVLLMYLNRTSGLRTEEQRQNIRYLSFRFGVYALASALDYVAVRNWWLAMSLSFVLASRLAPCAEIYREGRRTERKYLKATAGFGWLISAMLSADFMRYCLSVSNVPNILLQDCYTFLSCAAVALAWLTFGYGVRLAGLRILISWRTSRWRRKLTAARRALRSTV